MNVYEKLQHVQEALKAPKNQYNKFGDYHYRNCEDIQEAAKPLLKEGSTGSGGRVGTDRGSILH